MSPPRRRTSTDAARVALFRHAAAIAEANLAHVLTLEDVAAQVNSSPRQLRRAFAEAAGTSFGAFLREIRMARAAELLRQTDDPIKEIAATVGYTEPSQFTKAFRRSYGVTPREYRSRDRTSSMWPASTSPASDRRFSGNRDPWIP